MRTKDFEKAIEALGVHGLEVTKFSYGINGQVVAVYAKREELTFLMWDAVGRGFIYDINEDEECPIADMHPEYLDYRRDTDFDLKFD